MIVTVTMNPAIDKTVELDQFVHNGLNRVQNSTSDVGGKGINVSKTIHSLGGTSIATGFLAGDSGKNIVNALDQLGIQNDFVFVEGETRTNLKIVETGGILTEVNEKGPDIDEASLKALTDKLLSYAKEGTLFVLAGSVPMGVPKDIYQSLITLLKEKGAKVLLDVDGPMFVEGLEAAPHIVKPNQFELQQYFEIPGEISKEMLEGMGRKLLEKGIEIVAISRGADGAVFFVDGDVVWVEGLKVSAHSTVGAGDAMVAAIAYSVAEKRETKDWIRLAVATSAGAVTTIGTKPPTREVVDELMKQVKI